jgi:hypothetical protein
LAAAAFAAAALVTATVVATTAPLYIERRATPATDRGVRGKPMIASAFFTNPSLNGESGKKFASDRKTRDTASTMDLENFSMIHSFSDLFGSFTTESLS